MKRIAVLAALVCLSGLQAGAQSIEERVRRAASATYVHGMTQEIADREVGPEGVPYLLELLREPGFERRDNVMAFLAYLAYDSDATRLIEFLDNPPAAPDRPEEYRARLIVPEALGHIAARGGVVADDLLRQLSRAPVLRGDRGLAGRVDAALGIGEVPIDLEPGDDDEPGEPVPSVQDPQPVIRQHDLDYVNHVDVDDPITDAEVDALLAFATADFGKANSSGDTACCIQLVRTLPGGLFGSAGDGLDVIDDQSDLNAVMGYEPTRVKVVDYIGYCSGPGMNIIGCGNTPGDSIVVVRRSAVSLEGKLWAHEFGHNTGLGHHPEVGYVMYSPLTVVNNKLADYECNRFHFPSIFSESFPIQNGSCEDNDGDDVASSTDNCANVANPFQLDQDNDGLGDDCDNCDLDINPDQADCDLDGIGDVCDPVMVVPEDEVVGVGFQNKLRLIWDPVSFRKHVYRGSQAPGQAWMYNDTQVATVNTGDFWVDINLPTTNGELYYYIVKAFAPCGEGP